MVKKDDAQDDWGTPGEGKTEATETLNDIAKTTEKEISKAEAAKGGKPKMYDKQKEPKPTKPEQNPEPRKRKTFPSANGMRSEKSIILAVKTLQARYDYLIRSGKHSETDIVKVKEQINALLWATHSNFTNEEWLQV